MANIDFNSGFWSDLWVRKKNLEEKLLFEYLWTNDAKKKTGLYSLDIETAAVQTGITQAKIIKFLPNLAPKVRYCKETSVVWVVNHVRHQFLKTGRLSPTIKAGIEKDLIAMNGHRFVDLFLEHYSSYFHDTHIGAFTPYENPGTEEKKEIPEADETLEEAPDKGELVLSVPLIQRDGLFPIYEKDVKDWEETFPGVDVLQTLKIIRQWNKDHPGRRKTIKGIRSHISSWLGREQNRAPNKGSAPSSGGETFPEKFTREQKEGKDAKP